MLRQLARRHTQTTDVGFPTIQTHLKEWHNLRYSLRIPRVLEEDAQVVDNFLLQDRQTDRQNHQSLKMLPKCLEIPQKEDLFQLIGLKVNHPRPWSSLQIYIYNFPPFTQ